MQRRRINARTTRTRIDQAANLHGIGDRLAGLLQRRRSSGADANQNIRDGTKRRNLKGQVWQAVIGRVKY